MPGPASHGRPFVSLRRRHHHHHHRKPPKPTKSDPNPPTYMRSIIHNISSILRDSPWPAAQSQLQSLPLRRWDSFTVNQVLKTHPPMHKSWLFFNWAPARIPNFKHDKFTYTTMLDIFGEAGRIESMRHLFEQMVGSGVEPDGVTYTSVMHWLAKAGDVEGAVRVWEEMRRRGLGLTVVSYTAFMKVLFDCGRETEAAGVFREMIEVGLKPNCRTYTVLMEYLAGVGKFKAAFETMSKMQEAGIPPDKATCNILVQKCSKSGNTSAITHVLQYMQDTSIVLRRPVFLEALDAFKNSSKVTHLLREVNPHLAFEGIEEDIDLEPTSTDICYIIDRKLVINLLAKRNFIAIDHILTGMINKEIQLDSKLLSAVIQANCAYYRTSGALLVFQYCLKTNKRLDKSAYISLLGLFIRINSFRNVLEIVEQMVNSDIGLGTYLVSLLVHRLGCAGLSSFAAKIFHSFPTDQNVVTYTSLINAYFQAGEVDKGLELYARMRSQGITVAYGTYEVLIVGLEAAGKIHDAQIYRKEKIRLQWHNYSLESLSVEENLCNCLFDQSWTFKVCN